MVLDSLDQAVCARMAPCRSFRHGGPTIMSLGILPDPPPLKTQTHVRMLDMESTDDVGQRHFPWEVDGVWMMVGCLLVSGCVS